VNHYGDLAHASDSKCFRGFCVENLVDALDFEEVVAAAKRSKLGASPLVRGFACLAWVCSLDEAAFFFNVLQILWNAKSLFDCPLGAVSSRLVQLAG